MQINQSLNPRIDTQKMKMTMKMILLMMKMIIIKMFLVNYVRWLVTILPNSEVFNYYLFLDYDDESDMEAGFDEIEEEDMNTKRIAIEED
jgi:hypothetical protein